MFAGSYAGDRIARELDNVWIRRIFLATVVALAIRTIGYEVIWPSTRGT